MNNEIVFIITLLGTLASLFLAWYVLGKAASRAFQQKLFPLFFIGGVLFLWFLAAFFLSKNNFFVAKSTKEIVFPKILFTFLPLLLGGAWLFFSKTAKKIREHISQKHLIAIQFYRSLGIVFLFLWWTGKLPAIFAIPAGIGDVAVGLSAIFVARAYSKENTKSIKRVFWWNLFGILDLVFAIFLGFLTSPGPFHFLAPANPNFLITAYPLVLVPAFGVPLSLLLHFLSLQKNRDEFRKDAKTR